MSRPPNVQLSDDDRDRAADHCKAYRLRHQLTQMRMAIAMGCECAVISRIETKKGKRPSTIVAKILALELPPAPEPAAALAS